MKRSAELRDLSDEHHDALVLALHARRAAQGASAAEVTAAWAEVEQAFPVALAPHFAIEERWLAPPLAAARLSRHVRFEERELFPAAERVLPAAALAAIAGACRARRGGAD